MAYIKETVTAVGTLACALAIGYVMQSSEAASELYGNAKSDRALRSLDAETSMLVVKDITLTSAEFTEPDEPMSVDNSNKATVEPAASAPAQASRETGSAVPEIEAAACEISAKARPMAAAMVHLTLTAPCLPNERVTVHHNGMIFTQTTSKTGTLSVDAPALAKTAVFVFAFSNGDGAVAQAKVEDLEDFGRVVLQWKGDTGFQIHALEFGSDYNGSGHVWSGQPRSMASAITGEGGFITMNGDLDAVEPLVAEVYTFPADMKSRDGGVTLTVEAEVIQANCGTEIEAKSFELRGDDQLVTQDLSLAVPDCNALGSFLVLNNLLQDMKVASN